MADADDAAPGPVNLSGIVRHLTRKGFDIDRSAVQRFHATLGPVLGADGTNYPASALRWWEVVAEGRRDEKIQLRPENAAGWLELLMAQERAGGADSPMTNGTFVGGNRSPVTDDRLSVVEPVPVPAAVSGEQAERFLAAVERIAGNLAPPPGLFVDTLLSLEEAQMESGLSVGTLRRLPSIKEGRSRKWFRSTLAKHLDALRATLDDR